MEVVTLSNVVALASEISGVPFSASDAKFSEEQFAQLVDDIHAKINLLQKWEKNGNSSMLISHLLFDTSCFLFFSYKNSLIRKLRLKMPVA